MGEDAPFAYFDTSALVKRYVAESGSVGVRRVLSQYGVISSPVARVEICSALRRRRAEGLLSDAALRRVLGRVQADDTSWRFVALGDQVLALARACVLEHPLRTLDAIHVASAESLRRDGLSVPLVTADARQAAAHARGLDVIDVRSEKTRARS